MRFTRTSRARVNVVGGVASGGPRALRAETANHQNYNRQLPSGASAEDYMRLDWLTSSTTMPKGAFHLHGKHSRTAIALLRSQAFSAGLVGEKPRRPYSPYPHLIRFLTYKLPWLNFVYTWTDLFGSFIVCSSIVPCVSLVILGAFIKEADQHDRSSAAAISSPASPP